MPKISPQTQSFASRWRPNRVAKIRVHELAKELGIPAKEVMDRLREQGEFARSASSTVEAPVARRVRKSFGRESSPLKVEVQPSIDNANRYGADTEFDPSTPSARQFGWRAGAVAQPQHPDLLANIERVCKRYPILSAHLAALRSLGSQVVYAGFCRQEGFNGAAVVHVRFSGAIEAGFGFTREVMLFYSPHEDLQGRTFKAATKELQSTDRSVTPDTFFLWSPDPRVRTKLYDWSRPSSLAIPLLIDENEELSLIKLLRDHIYTRDLFYVTTPVSGASFFGRRTLLQSMRDDVFNQRVTGVFGLRKSGKTSILTQLSEELKDDKVVTILMDLETFPCPPEDPTDDILADLRQRLLWELRSRGLRTRELEEIGQRPGILELKNALQAVLKNLKEDGTRILLLLDEIEYLTPADKIDIAEGEMPRIAQMLSAFRSIVQESENFTFTLSGLTSAIIESGRLYGRPNPLFSWARAVYVTPLDREEADDLASTVGGKMGIEITSGALEALHEASGGHAFLYRSLSSAVVSHLPVDDLKRTMSRSAVLTEISDWKSRIQGNIEEMIQHVKRYYPNESVMLEILMDSADDFKELAPEEHVAVRRLKDLGLIVETDGEFEVSVILELV
ncbi:hypothetical protein GQ649_18065 [Rhodococcus sp. DSM 6344]|nr:hypothetical protein [Rhodococcus erythropolis]